MGRWVRRQQEEIAADRALSLYGACLSAVELLTAWWLWRRHLSTLLGHGGEAICWPFFPSCHVARVFPPLAIDGVVLCLAALSLGAGIAFLLRPRWGWWLLLFSETLKLIIVVQDFRLRANQHYMAFFAIATFLLLPDKRRTLRYVVILFYVWAGTLKLNGEWLSGAALYAPLWFFTGSMVPVACGYVLVLELVMVWGLLSRRPVIFWGTLGQLALFHLFSFPIVGAFYPLLMAGILAIYPLCRVWPTAEAAAFRGERRTTWALLGGFSLLQLVPLAFPGDTALTGEGRLFSLHMFDARIQCRARAVLRDAKGAPMKEIDLMMDLPTRIRCDPLVYFDRAQTLCRELEPGGLDLDLKLDSRRSTQPELRPVIAADRFCAQHLSYDVWRSNPWILK